MRCHNKLYVIYANTRWEACAPFPLVVSTHEKNQMNIVFANDGVQHHHYAPAAQGMVGDDSPVNMPVGMKDDVSGTGPAGVEATHHRSRTTRGKSGGVGFYQEARAFVPSSWYVGLGGHCRPPVRAACDKADR